MQYVFLLLSLTLYLPLYAQWPTNWENCFILTPTKLENTKTFYNEQDFVILPTPNNANIVIIVRSFQSNQCLKYECFRLTDSTVWYQAYDSFGYINKSGKMQVFPDLPADTLISFDVETYEEVRVVRPILYKTGLWTENYTSSNGDTRFRIGQYQRGEREGLWKIYTNEFLVSEPVLDIIYMFEKGVICGDSAINILAYNDDSLILSTLKNCWYVQGLVKPDNWRRILHHWTRGNPVPREWKWMACLYSNGTFTYQRYSIDSGLDAIDTWELKTSNLVKFPAMNYWWQLLYLSKDRLIIEWVKPN